jgi:hypothetical protein
MLLIGLDLLLRLHIVYFLAEVVLMPEDPRFAGKAIPIRNLVIVGGMSFLFPAVQLFSRRWARYPWGSDCLYLSIFWLDMAGNSFDLYRRYEQFDLIPHFHGTGALAGVLHWAFELRALPALLWANAIHAALEAQEILTDVFFGTRNVRGPLDTVRDIVVGLVGSALYVAVPLLVRRRAR